MSKFALVSKGEHCSEHGGILIHCSICMKNTIPLSELKKIKDELRNKLQDLLLEDFIRMKKGEKSSLSEPDIDIVLDEVFSKHLGDGK